MSDHLTPETSDRGFKRLPPIEARHGLSRDVVSAGESSAADSPHIWLTVEGRPLHDKEGSSGLPDVEEGRIGWMSAHLTVEDARKLAEQLTWLCDNHYQNGDDSE